LIFSVDETIAKCNFKQRDPIRVCVIVRLNMIMLMKV